jgi:hypothetical protein
MRPRVSGALALAIVSASCSDPRKPAPDVVAPPPSTAATSTTPPLVPEPKSDGRRREITLYFRGKIGGREATMELTEDKDALSGSYGYELGVPELRGVLRWLSLTGTTSPDGGFVLKETLYSTKPGEDQREEETGVFRGRIVRETIHGRARQRLRGVWSRPNGEKKATFDLRESVPDLGSTMEVLSREIDDESNPRVRVHATYPEIAPSTSSVAVELNRRAKGMVKHEIDSFTKEAIEPEESEETDNAETEGEESDSEEEERSGYIEVWYECTLATKRIVSIRIDEAFYAPGAAHPSGSVMVLNVDRRTARDLSLADLFRPRSKYLAKLSAIVGTLNGKRSYDISASPRAEDFARWTASPYGLHFYFDVAHALGDTVEAFVPYSALKAELDPAGPVP